MSPGLEFREGDLLELDLPSGRVAGIVAFCAIVNLPSQQVAIAFSEMWRSLEPDGLLLLAFHVGDEIVRPDELWGVPLTMAFYMHSPVKIRENLSAAGFAVEEIIEREPYPDVEHQSRRAYIFARKHAAGVEASDA